MFGDCFETTITFHYHLHNVFIANMNSMFNNMYVHVTMVSSMWKWGCSFEPLQTISALSCVEATSVHVCVNGVQAKTYHLDKKTTNNVMVSLTIQS